MKTAFWLALTSLVVFGCGEEDIGQQTGGAITDTRVMKEATAAANEVIRNATDCEVVKRAAPDVYRRLDEAAAKIQTTTGQTSIESLRAQVKRVTDTCGAS